MLRGLCFAIVDEADSVLIDDASTPLILSRKNVNEKVNPTIYQQALYLANQLIVEEDYSVKSQERQVVITSRGLARVAKSADQLGPFWQQRRQREELMHQALCAQYLYIRDRDSIQKHWRVSVINSFSVAI